MTGYWLWLLILACPMMMMFMMRGMGRGSGGMRRPSDHTRLPGLVSERPPAARPLTAEEQKRLAQLEHDLAQLRAGKDTAPGDTPTSTR